MKHKTILIIVIIIIVIILSYFTFLKLRPMIAFKIALQKASKFYPKEILSNVEKIFRLETDNFKSGQFTGTFSPGMEKFSDTYPYGWKSLKPYWDANIMTKPIGLKTFTENNTGIQKTFIKFPTLNASVFTLCKWLSINKNNPARWFSTNDTSMASYQKKLDNINPVITNEIFS